MRAASCTVRVIGPTWDKLHAALGGAMGMRPKDALCPKMPANDAGIRIEPPPSVPMAMGPRPAATAALAPPDEPPGVRPWFHGFFVTPNSGLWVAPIQPNVGVLVLPSWIAPAAFSRSTIGASSAGTLSA